MKFGVRLTFIFILIGFLPLLIGGVFLFYFFEGYFKETTYGNLEEVRDVVFLEIEYFFEESLTDMDSLSRNVVLISEESSEEEVEEEIQRILDRGRLIFKDIAVLDKEKDNAVSVRESGYEKEELEKWILKAKERKEVVISDILFSEAESPFFVVFYPNLDEERRVVSFIIAEVDVSSLIQEFDFRQREKREVMLISSEGEIMIDSKREYLSTRITENYPLRENSLAGRGNFDFYFQGGENIASFRVIDSREPYPGWHLVVIQPKTVVFGFLRSMAVNYGVLMIFLLFFIILVSFFIAKKIITPLRVLSAVAKKVSRGDLEVQANISSRDEFGELAENFNKMINELREAKEKMEEEKNILEIKVDARTKELNQLNKELEGKVKKRTEEMEKKLRELQKMSKLMVGRELKMVEMKKKFKEMKEELEKFKKVE